MLRTSTTRGLRAMTSETGFPHRKNANLTFDAICPKCFQTISNQKLESDLNEGEVAHSCPGAASLTGDKSLLLVLRLIPSLRVRRHPLCLRKRGRLKTASHGSLATSCRSNLRRLGQRMHRKYLRFFPWPLCEIPGLPPPELIRILRSACHRRLTEVYV